MSDDFTSRFPQPARTVHARWAPIYLSPIMGSPERLVVAVAAASSNGFHIESANALKRLECLYGSMAETALFAIEVAIDELRTALTASGPTALAEGALVFSGVTVGEVKEGEARTEKDLAITWMTALSSLYKFNRPAAKEGEVVVDFEQARATISDRLPILVLDHIRSVAPTLSQYFSEEIRSHRQRRATSGIAGVNIDYAGSKYVANFATLQASTQASSVDRIKRKMFDLKVRRDAEHGLFQPRSHEMIVFTPPRNSPLVTEAQQERLDDALSTLGEQSKSEGFDLLAMHEVPEIGRRVLEGEALAA